MQCFQRSAAVAGLFFPRCLSGPFGRPAPLVPASSGPAPFGRRSPSAPRPPSVPAPSVPSDSRVKTPLLDG
jgi:hypothetical protein